MTDIALDNLIEQALATTTAEILAAMLKEPTGRSMFDSGGIPKYNQDGCYLGSSYGYGRRFERNQCRDFERELAANVWFDYGEINYSANLYHWLKDRLEFQPILNELWEEWNDAFDDELRHKTWSQCLDLFFKWLQEQGCQLTAGPYGESDGYDSFYTYNYDNILSQNFIAYIFYLNADKFEWGGKEYEFYDEPIAFIQIHNGCDARGGFTEPKAFSPIDEPADLYLFSDGYIYTNDGYSWYTDDGYHWKPTGSDTPQLDSPIITELGEDLVIRGQVPVVGWSGQIFWTQWQLIIPYQDQDIPTFVKYVFALKRQMETTGLKLQVIGAESDEEYDENSIYVDDQGHGYFRDSRIYA